jgi:hypothetical protein
MASTHSHGIGRSDSPAIRAPGILSRTVRLDDLTTLFFEAFGLQKQMIFRSSLCRPPLRCWLRCSKNFIIVNVMKTIYHEFWICNAVLQLQTSSGANDLAIDIRETYVGWISAQTQWICSRMNHSKAKASTTRYCAHRIIGIEHSVGDTEAFHGPVYGSSWLSTDS